MIYDKRQAIAGRRRVRESTLLLIAALGGAAGSLVGMLLAWHKVRKPEICIFDTINVCIAGGYYLFSGGKRLCMRRNLSFLLRVIP